MFRIARMSAEKALRRVRQLNGVLGRTATDTQLRSQSTDGTVSIGDVSVKLRPAKNPELVPIKHISDNPPQTVMRHLRWIMQKDLLGQDVFLIGSPGPLRRAVAMQYAELTNREVEYIALTRDTTETDLKQRREIRSSTAFYIDQCAVKAATQGRILIIEGIEKAERNVLPVINNLLENREMQLEDGRFLMAADRYDKLLQEHTQEELDSWKLVRVSENFRVIALGLPVPLYRGNPLDPPLRSRFQARDINPLPFKDQLQVLYGTGPSVAPDRISQVLSFATTLLTSESTSMGLPDFPVEVLASLIKILDSVPNTSPHKLLHRLYPYEFLLAKEGKTAVEDTLKKFELFESDYQTTVHHVIGNVHPVTNSDAPSALVTLQAEGLNYPIQVSAGVHGVKSADAFHHFIGTPSHARLLADMMQSHMVHDFCLVGPKGCGKTVLTREFANMLGYHMEPIMLYQDMTSRDLVQQRTTLPNGDTTWRPSALVNAATEGNLAVLDGIHRINPGTLAALQRLIHDREFNLFDGTRLVRHDRYDELKKKSELSDEEMRERKVLPIHPSFRILALAEPPVTGSSTQQWLNSELLTLFHYHHVKPLSYVEEMEVIQGMVPNAVQDLMDPLLKFTHRLRNSGDTTLLSLASSLSTRQLLRIARRLAQYPNENLHDAINKACLSRFLPKLAKQSLEKSLEDANIKPFKPELQPMEIEKAVTCEIKEGVLRIGKTQVLVYNPENKMMVPDVLFYENPQHLSIMEDMLKDFLLGEHLLLVGNQGVGKNKIVDRFLHLLNRPRQYLQLHRDTTVQTLTLQPNVQDGVIIYEDSPLVRAVKLGHVLVVDEADKAPTNVTCILKTLVESGEMILADGRRIISGHPGQRSTENTIVSHPDFRMIVLANRPGFPFLGNDFFGSLGDIFSCHAVDNPNMESEMSMLRQYGPNVPEHLLKKLVLAFGELREMADQGLIAYPYSTREVVNMVKHLEKFPTEGLSNVVRNVFDFDAYNKEMRESIVTALHKHGIPIGATPDNVKLAKEFELPEPKLTSHWRIGSHPGSTKRQLLCPVEEKQVRVKGPVFLNVKNYPLDKYDDRSLEFSELMSHWNLPLEETSMIGDVAASTDLLNDIIHVVTSSPVGLYSTFTSNQAIKYVDLYDVFPNTRYSWHPKFKLAALGSPLDGQALIHEEQTNTILLLDPNTGALRRLFLSSALEGARDKIAGYFSGASDQPSHKMCSEFSFQNWAVFYEELGSALDVVDVLQGTGYSIDLPINLKSVHLPSKDAWLLTEAETNRRFLLTRPSPDMPVCQFNPVDVRPAIDDNETPGFSFMTGAAYSIADRPLPKDQLSTALGQNIDSPNRVMADSNHHAAIAVGFPDLQSESDIYTIPRKPVEEVKITSKQDPIFKLASKTVAKKEKESVFLSDCNQAVKVLPLQKVPTEVFPQGLRPKGVSAYLEVTDLDHHRLRYIPIPMPTYIPPYSPWLSNYSETDVAMTTTPSESIVTVDAGGCIRLWETGVGSLHKSLIEWQQMIGSDEGRLLQINFEKEDTGKDATSPKHGKIDKHNQPHVGGNTWAGGTGGRDTAGLGGKGGPYRLDAGHDVHQVSQVEKDSVPEEVKRAAREMAQKAFKQRLREIQMSEYDAELYEKFSSGVRRQVRSLRVILDSLQAKGKERQWLRHQTSGDLDDFKLIEGLTGEKSIYKRRGEQDPELGSPQMKPKRLRIVVDLSGSMYRFNGVDGRLDRVLEAALMVMEAFEGYDKKFKYEIVGHSGESYSIDFITGEKAPRNNKERLDIIKTMHAHSQFCMSGDYTLEATKYAIEAVSKQEADEHFVIVLSDANFDRYGISPSKFAQILTADEKVNAFSIFIGSLGDQAQRLAKNLPTGHAFICMDTKDIPQVLQQIFTSTMLSTR
ncbi:von Willebrand factor A domain-containing protein 8-like [Ptychodera flava]|uniref:von Willebrand factor A domain-containing protein 8-like n=1 Tax=Ptychodera flava TaxID=63121 RepID=UPI00396A36DE